MHAEFFNTGLPPPVAAFGFRTSPTSRAMRVVLKVLLTLSALGILLKSSEEKDQRFAPKQQTVCSYGKQRPGRQP